MKHLGHKLIISGLLVFSQSIFAMTLQETIKISLENNPKTKSNQLVVQAIEDRVKAQRLSWYPKLNLNAGYDFSDSKLKASEFSKEGHSLSRSGSISTSMTIYDGGATRYSQRQVEADLEATRSRYNSSNTQIPNTAGSIAQGVKNAYVNLIEISERRKSFEKLSQNLQIFLKAAKTDEEKVLVQQHLNELKSTFIEIEYAQAERVRDFFHIATVTAPAEMQSFDEAISTLIVPRNADEAFQIALEKSPNIKTSKKQLEAAEFRYKSEKANWYAPQVSISASLRNNSTSGSNNVSESNVAEVGINLRYTLDAATGLRNSAASKTVEAAQTENESVIEETKYDIESIYPLLKHQEEIYISQYENLKSLEQELNQLISKINGGSVVDIKFALNILDGHRAYNAICMAQKIQILNTRFNIQRSVGTLFENVHLTKNLN